MSQAEQLYIKPGHSGIVLKPTAYGVGDTPRLEYKGASQWSAHCVSTSSATFTPQGSLDGQNWVDLESAITPTAGTVHRGDCTGFPYVRFAIAGGTAVLGFALTVGSGTSELLTPLNTLVNAASALDTNIVKYNGSEYTIQRVRGLAVGAATTTALVAAHATKYNMILSGTIHVATGGSTATLRITDGTIDLFGGASTTKPLDITGAAGVFGYNLPTMVTGAVNRAINAVTTGASPLVADFDYIQF